jgi:hypothetical protein
MEFAGTQRATSAEEAGETEVEKLRSEKSIEELMLWPLGVWFLS